MNGGKFFGYRSTIRQLAKPSSESGEMARVYLPPGGGVCTPNRPVRGGGVAGIREGATSGVGCNKGFAIHLHVSIQPKASPSEAKATHVSIVPMQASLESGALVRM